MKILWCWRCKTDVPMLDDGEFRSLMQLRGTGAKGTVKERIFGPVLDEYARLTGVRETNPNAIFHHVLSLYGPPCPACLRPLRTPRAKYCASCDASYNFE